MKKQKELKLLEYNKQANWSVYPHVGFMFAFCGSITGKREVPQLTSFEGCRESLICRVFDRKAYKIPTSRMRCLIRTIVATDNAAKGYELFDKQTNAGLRILNIMEKHNGWPLTKMHNVETITAKGQGSQQNRRVFIKMLEGSSKWLKSPHMISLFFLLVRLPTRHSRFIEIKNYKQLMGACKLFAGRSNNGDRYSVRNTIGFWNPLMSNFGKMFRGMPLDNNFNKRNYGQFYHQEGILTLCSFNSTNKKIGKRFVALACEAKIKVPKAKMKAAGL